MWNLTALKNKNSKHRCRKINITGNIEIEPTNEIQLQSFNPRFFLFWSQ